MIVSAVVILYNPEDEVFENIDLYGDSVEKIFIIDNSEAYNKKSIGYKLYKVAPFYEKRY